MLQNNPLLAQLKAQLHQDAPRVEGIVKAHEKGYGFLEADNKKSYFIPTSQMRHLLPGDHAKGLVQTEKDKSHFEAETVLQSGLQRFIAQVVGKAPKLQLQAENSLIKSRFIISNANAWQEQLNSGDWVVAELTQHPLQNDTEQFQADVVEHLTHKNDPLANWIRCLARYQLEYQMPQAESPALLVGEDEAREDLTALPFFTIDSRQTQDMDDAITISEGENNQLQLMVAIADPSAYTTCGDSIDQQAAQRLFSTYLPELTIPMLPESLANELCSLKAHTKRPVVVCKLLIEADGSIAEPKQFMLAWIESKAKLDYQSISDYLEQAAPWPDPASQAEIDPQLALLQQFVVQRQQWRKSHALQLKSRPDYRFILDKQRQVINIVREERRSAHVIIEEAMIAANQALAEYLTQQQLAAIFNVHRGFDIKYLDLINKLLQEQQINNFDKQKLSSFAGYCQLQRQLVDYPKLQARISRYQSPADFSFTPEPHCGLGMNTYLTWTSPIRKYSDLINHRILKALLRKQALPQPDEALLKKIAERRKLLRLAERDLSNLLYCQYLGKHLNEAFNAEVIDINKGGARVYLTQIGAIAFMPLSLIHAKRQQIESHPEAGTIEINKTPVMQLGDNITVTINEIKTESNSIIVQWQAN